MANLILVLQLCLFILLVRSSLNTFPRSYPSINKTVDDVGTLDNACPV
jgi:hypothetical protein